MAGETGDVVLGLVGAELVEQQERIELRQRLAADDAGELDPGAVRRGGATDLADDAGVSGGLHGKAPVGCDGPVMEAMMRRHQPHRWNARCQHCRSALGGDRLYPEAVAPECAPTGQMSVAATCPDLWRLQAPGLADAGVEIGCASGREKVCKVVYISVVSVS